MDKERNRKAIGLIIVIFMLAIHFSQPAQNLRNFPEEISLVSDREKSLQLDTPFVTIHLPNENILRVRKAMGASQDGDSEGRRTGINLSLSPVAFGNAVVEFRLLGLIPLKKISVNVVPSLYLMPGGQSIGVLLQTKGVVITGLGQVTDPRGRQSSPARDAGLKIGDSILEINGEACRSEGDLSRMVNSLAKSGQTITLTVNRQGTGSIDYITVVPVLSRDTMKYQIGIIGRDNTAGVGTMTFFHEPSGIFGALGHVISDGINDSPLELTDGRIVRATVTGINEGSKGHPGEKIGLFIEDRDVIGKILRNSRFGVFGVLNKPQDNPFFDKPIPVAMAHEVRPGLAEIYTVVQGQKLERFQVEIQKVFPQTRPDDKGMIVKVTDPRLLGTTGGIVQGMSGSPIIQNGRLIGAVTHVFVNDPTRGYGVFIEWMIQDSGYAHQMQSNEGEARAAMGHLMATRQ